MVKEKLKRISLEIEIEMKALDLWSTQRDNGHPQISTPSDWVQWDYLPAALSAIEEDQLPAAYGNIEISNY